MADNDNRTRLFPGLADQVKAAGKPDDGPDGKPDNVVPFRREGEEPAPQTWTNEKRSWQDRGRLILRLLLLALLLAAVILGILWATSTDFDAMRRSYTYRGVQRDEQGVTAVQPLLGEKSMVNCMGRRVAMASQQGLQIFDEDGYALADCMSEL